MVLRADLLGHFTYALCLGTIAAALAAQGPIADAPTIGPKTPMRMALPLSLGECSVERVRDRLKQVPHY